MDEQPIVERLLASCEIHNEIKYISCSLAFQIASEFNVSPGQIGRLCNREKIKLRRCQLGCF